MKIITQKDIEIAQALMEQASRGAKLSFAERNIINIVKHRHRSKPIMARLVLTPTNIQRRGLIKNKWNNQYKMWMGATINFKDWDFFNQYLLFPDGTKQPLNAQQNSDIIQGKLKNGDSIKLVI